MVKNLVTVKFLMYNYILKLGRANLNSNSQLQLFRYYSPNTIKNLEAYQRPDGNIASEQKELTSQDLKGLTLDDNAKRYGYKCTERLMTGIKNTSDSESK